VIWVACDMGVITCDMGVIWVTCDMGGCTAQSFFTCVSVSHVFMFVSYLCVASSLCVACVSVPHPFTFVAYICVLPR
jgi:hypothetical protein